MKKKLIYSVIAISLIAIVVFAYIQMNGNPIEKNKSKESLEEFLEQTYPEMDYKINRSAKYGWVDGTFRFNVVTKDSIGVKSTYPFDISTYEPYEIFSDTIHISKIDKEASKKLNKEAEQYILALLKEKVLKIDGVSTDVEVYGKVAEEWTPQLKTPKPIHIMMGLEKATFTKEQMLEQSKTIQQHLNDESIDYYITEIGYYSFVDGEKIYDYISFKPDQKLTIEDVN